MKVVNFSLISFILFYASCITIKPAETGKIEIGNPLGFCHAGMSKTDREYKLLDDLGCEWIRVDYRWDKIEKEPGKFDFQSMDKLTQMALQHNRKILAVLCYDAGWIHSDKKSHKYIPLDYYDPYLHYIIKTVTRYKDQVAAFEIWNEPNNRLKSFWGGTDEEFFELFKKATQAIKKIDSTIIVTTPGLFRGDERYVQKMFESGAMKNVDVISFHPYSVTMSGYLKQIEQVKEKGERYGYNGEYWISEIGNPTGGLYPFRVSEDNLPARIVKTLVYGLAKDIRVITWYHLFDHEERRKFNSEDFFGLVIRDKDYTYKKGAYAFRAIAKNIPGSYLLNSKVQCNKGYIQYYHFQHDDGNCLLVLWSEKGRHKVTISVPGDECLQWSISSPDIKVLSDFPRSLEIGKEPIVITFNNKEKPYEDIIISEKKRKR